jgi:hypothetical protein
MQTCFNGRSVEQIELYGYNRQTKFVHRTMALDDMSVKMLEVDATDATDARRGTSTSRAMEQ